MSELKGMYFIAHKDDKSKYLIGTYENPRWGSFTQARSWESLGVARTMVTRIAKRHKDIHIIKGIEVYESLLEERDETERVKRALYDIGKLKN